MILTLFLDETYDLNLNMSQSVLVIRNQLDQLPKDWFNVLN